MAGPTELIRQNCPPVVASSGGVGGNDGLLTAQQYEQLLAGSGGGVTSLTQGAGIELTPNPIVGAGTIAIANTTVTPGSYTSANITVGADGRITAAADGDAATDLGWFNVREYGATGNGTTDDTVSIQAAADALAASVAGGTLYYPPGLYKQTPVNITAPLGGRVIVKGAGGDSIVLIDSLGDDGFAVNMNSQNGSSFEMRDLVLRNIDTDQPPDECCDSAVSVIQGAYSLAKFTNVTVVGVYAGTSGFEVNGGGVVFDGITFVGCATPKHFKLACYSSVVRNVRQIDIGGFGGITWTGQSYPITTLVHATGSGPNHVSETLSGSYLLVENVRHDELIFRGVVVDGSVNKFGSVVVRGLHSQLTSVANAIAMNIQHCYRFYAEDVYANTLSAASPVWLLYLDYVDSAECRRIVGETGHTSASIIEPYSNCGTIHLVDSHYSVITNTAGAVIRVETSGSVQLPVYSDGTRPAANSVTAGTMIFNTSDNFPNVSDGTNWRDMAGGVT